VEPLAAFIRFLLERHAIGLRGETICIPVTWFCDHQLNENEAELIMNSRISDNSEKFDRKTSRSICDAVGERLQQDLRPDSLRPSSHLQHLIDELRRRDNENQRKSAN
jgi:hypothetical protein